MSGGRCGVVARGISNNEEEVDEEVEEADEEVEEVDEEVEEEGLLLYILIVENELLHSRKPTLFLSKTLILISVAIFLSISLRPLFSFFILLHMVISVYDLLPIITPRPIET